MTRSELKELGIEEKATIDAIMKLYGDGIETVKAETEKLKVVISEKETTIADLSEKAKNLDGTETALKELNDKIASYEKEKSDREAAETQAKLDSELRQRFLANVGENKFKHEDIENGRFNAFKSALADEKYKGKGDSDIFAEVTKDMDLYVNPQQATITMPGGRVETGNLDGVEKAFMQRNPSIKF